MCFQNACRDLIDDLGYSGDFGWPMDEAIQVDQLVLDSTNGSVRQTRRYSEEEADEALVELVRESDLTPIAIPVPMLEQARCPI